jgi:enamine deaminase RidA (YjgF/YER057c/UK114 family)
MTIYVTDGRYRDALREVTVRYVGEHPPASTLVVVAGLAEPEFLIEIDGVAFAGA